jgi:hypothetical protein
MPMMRPGPRCAASGVALLDAEWRALHPVPPCNMTTLWGQMLIRAWVDGAQGITRTGPHSWKTP